MRWTGIRRTIYSRVSARRQGRDEARARMCGGLGGGGMQKYDVIGYKNKYFFIAKCCHKYVKNYNCA